MVRLRRSRSLAVVASLVLLSLASTAPASADDVVVRMRSDAGHEAVARAVAGARLTDARHLPGGIVAYRAADAGAAARRLKRDGVASWARPSMRARIAAVPGNDTGGATTSGLAGGWQQVQWDLVGPFGIDVAGAWPLAEQAGGEGGRGVKVAVLDTGVAYADRGRYRQSPELPTARVLRGYDFVADDP